MSKHDKIQYLLIFILGICLIISNYETPQPQAGALNIGESSDGSVYLTGFNWLQLNQASDNKISLTSDQTRVTSPWFNWNGDTIATQEWVRSYVCPE